MPLPTRNVDESPEEFITRCMADAVMTGVETRTSSPLRIGRDAGLQSPNTRGLFPAGEGHAIILNRCDACLFPHTSCRQSGGNLFRNRSHSCRGKRRIAQ